MSTALSVIIGPEPSARLDKALARDVPEAASLSRTRLARLIADGQVKLNGAVVTDGKARVAEGDVVEIEVPQAVETHIGPEDIPLDILFEDDDLIVVNKPAGMVVHPAPGTPGGTLVNALLHHFGGDLSGVGGVQRPGIVHRIDKDTTGLLVVAKTDRAHHGLAAQFEKHTVGRAYTALVYGVPEIGDPRLRGLRGVSAEQGGLLCLTTQLARHRTDRQRQAVLFQGGKHAVTRVRTIERFGTPPAAAEVECRLQTGRTHQIRVHMAYAGHGLIGDTTYGGKRKISPKAISETAMQAIQAFPRQALHARLLEFVHPASGDTMRFQADLPQDMADLVSALRT